MSKKSYFRGCLEKQYGKCTQALSKSGLQHLYPIHWSLAWNFCSKKSLLFSCQILGMHVNTLASDKKYPVLNRQNLMIPFRMQLCHKQNPFSDFFAAFPKSRLSFKYFEKKLTLTASVFPKLRTLNTWLDKCLKSLALEDPSTGNMVNVQKYCWNLYHSTRVILIDRYQGNWVGKSLSYWHAKSWDFLLTYWLPMKSISFFVGTI